MKLKDMAAAAASTVEGLIDEHGRPNGFSLEEIGFVLRLAPRQLGRALRAHPGALAALGASYENGCVSVRSEAPAPVEIQPDTGHPAGVLAKLVMAAIEAHVASPDNADGYEDVARRALMTKQQLNNIKRAIEAARQEKREHVIDGDVAEALLAAIGLRLTTAPADEEHVRRVLEARQRKLDERREKTAKGSASS